MTQDQIIEAIARQECIAEGYDPDEMTTGFASNPTTPKYPFWKAYVSGTEATLAALRATGFWVAPWEATISMEVAGEDAYDRTPAASHDEFKNIYTAMRDAFIKRSE